MTTTQGAARGGSAPGTRAPRSRSTAGRTPGRPRRAAVGAWLLRLVRHRSWAQRRLLTVTGTVALLVAAVVATLAVLADAGERLGVPAALLTDADRTRVTLTLGALEMPVPDVLATAEETLVDVLGAPVTSQAQVTSVMYDVARPGRSPGYAYLDRRDGVADAAELVAGRWPDGAPGADGADGPVPVAAPAGGTRHLGIDLGETWTLRSQSGDEDVVVEVVGLYEVPAPHAEHWSRDRLGGQGYQADFPVPFSGGWLTTEAVGPFVVAPEAADAGVFAVRRMVVRVDPDLGGVTAADLPALRRAVAGLGDELAFRLDEDAGNVSVGSDLPRVLREAATGVVVTRAGVAVATVLLLLVAVAALLQTARLINEARSAEHDLLRARGASRGHLLAAVAGEAALLGVVVAALAPVAGLVATRALGGPLAGAYDLADPLAALRALPWTAWAAGVVVAFLLVAVSVVPLLRAPATFVEGQQARGRRGRRGSLARLAADLAAVGAAALGWTQLRAYGGPLVGSGERLAADPVLAVGPGLLLLAGALVGVRVLPLAGRALERLARRGRGLVVPLAGWDVGRRSHHAGSAVLLLTVAIAAATFGLTERATWQRSQEDQAAFAVGSPVVVADAASAGVDGRALATAGVVPEPVLRDSARVARRTLDGIGGWSASGVSVEIVAATSPARASLDRGRVAREGGAAVAALPAAPPTVGGVELGEAVVGVSTTVELAGARMPEAAAVSLRLVLEDAAGALSTVGLGVHTAEATANPVTLLLPGLRLPVGAGSPQGSADALAEAAAGRTPVRLVGVQALVVATDSGVRWSADGAYDFQVTLRDLSVLRPADDVDAVPDDAWASGGSFDGRDAGIVSEPVGPPPAQWWPTGAGIATDPLVGPDGDLWLRFLGSVQMLPDAPAVGALVAWEPVDEVPTVLTADLADQLEDATTRGFEIGLAETSVPVVVADVVPRVPATSGGAAVAVDHTTLVRALLQRGASGTFVDEWWVDPADAEAYLAALPPDVDGRPRADRATTLAGTATGLLEHPVRVAIPLVLALLALGGALVAGVGFAVHTAVTIRERDLELAQLRAVGLTRGRLTAAVALESGLLAGLGVVLGVGTGVGVAALVGRLLVVAADGDPPVPEVELVVPPTVAWLAVAILAVVAVLTVAVAAAQRTADPASLLRAGEAR